MNWLGIIISIVMSFIGGGGIGAFMSFMSIKKKCDNEIDKIKESHKANIDDNEKKHKADIERIQKEHENELEKMKLKQELEDKQTSTKEMFDFIRRSPALNNIMTQEMTRGIKNAKRK